MLRRILGVLFAAVLLLPASGSGQAAGAPTRVPVTVVLVERLPVPGAPFVVQRRPGAAQQDVILLPAGADATLFSEAVQMLLVARQAGGDTPVTAATMRVRPQRGRNTPRRVLPWAQRVLNDLRRAEARPVEGIGTVQAVEICARADARVDKSLACSFPTRQASGGLVPPRACRPDFFGSSAQGG